MVTFAADYLTLIIKLLKFLLWQKVKFYQFWLPCCYVPAK
jgi:hypothetical protein